MRKSLGKVVVVLAAAYLWPAAAAQTVSPPDFSASGGGWLNRGVDFILPKSGPGPVTWDPAHPYTGNTTQRIADLTNPILMPWVREALKKFNDEALTGKQQFRPIARCWPAGVPGSMLLRVNPMFIAQTPTDVWFLYQSDHQYRRIRMNRDHSANVTPSWYGESVGHYEGDTLVVDTIGVSTKVAVDYYLTPHTERMHIVERYRMIDGGKTLEVNFTVDDPGAFNMAWSGGQRYERFDEPMREVVCPEGQFGFGQEDLAPIPQDETPDY